MRDSSVPSSRSCTGQDILDRGRGPMQTVDQMDGWLELVQRALMRLCFIWKAISACLHHNRKGNKQSSSQRVAVTVLCFDPFYHIWPSNDTLSQQRKKSLKCVCVCVSEALHASGPVRLEPRGLQRKSIQSIHQGQESGRNWCWWHPEGQASRGTGPWGPSSPRQQPIHWVSLSWWVQQTWLMMKDFQLWEGNRFI